MKNKNLALIFGIVVFLFLLACAGWLVYESKLKTAVDVPMYEYDGKWYTEDELKEIVGPQYINTPAKNTPEEVYVDFRKAILAGDTEKALEYIWRESKEEYREEFNNPEMMRLYKTIPEVDELIEEKEERYDNYASFIYYDKDMNPEKDPPYTIDFIKDEKGYWQIESL